jgi:sugar lactone lactonase YvrE
VNLPRQKGVSFPLVALLLMGCATSTEDANARDVSEPRWLAKLDPSKGELPEGLAIDSSGTTAFIGLAPTGQVLKVDVATSTVSAFGSVPPVPPNGAYLLGLALSSQGELFAAVASSSEYPAGVYRFAGNGGAATLFATHEELQFPNGMVFDEGGNLLVTDSLSGAIFRVSANASVTRWASDPLLRGDLDGPCTNGAQFPIGANGIAISGGAAFVLNTDMGSMLRIPIERDGNAGPVTTFAASDCATLGGADGLAVSSAGQFFVAANAIDAITEVSPAGEAHVLIEAPELDFPASPALVQSKDGSTLFVTNGALRTAQTPGAEPLPGLLSFSLGGP